MVTCNSNTNYKKITDDQNSLLLKPNFKNNIKKYLMAAYLPSILIAIGTIIYFIIFPNHLDLSLVYVKNLINGVGQEINIPILSTSSLILISFCLIIIAPLVIINHILAFCEELGWRGDLLPLLCNRIGITKGIIVDGMLWGLVHAPLICFGINYSGNYFASPFSGILMMVVFAIFLGIFLSYLTIKANSIIPACIAHGVTNAVREAPLFICITSYNALLGLKPSGIIGMIGFILLDIIILIKLNKELK